MTSLSEPEAGRSERPRAAIVGTGLIGGSIGLALRARGWHVTGRDLDGDRAARALELGALDAVGDDPTADITFVCTPVLSIAAEARAALAGGRRGHRRRQRQGPVVAAVDDPRFVGGHPMAGSEQDGVDGADAELFEGPTWVLTPGVDTDPEAFTRVRSLVSSMGADVVALQPDRHDQVVAMVSHVPHLTAATLMALATDGATEHAALLRLAAGGFRDMTRIAAGAPGIWPDICAENRDRHRRVPRPPGGGAGRHARPGRHRRPGRPARRPPAGPGGPRQPARPAAQGPRSWPRSGCRCPTGRACWPRSPPCSAS